MTHEHPPEARPLFINRPALGAIEAANFRPLNMLEDSGLVVVPPPSNALSCAKQPNRSTSHHIMSLAGWLADGRPTSNYSLFATNVSAKL